MAFVPRLFVPDTSEGDERLLPEGAAHHLERVLRLRAGAEIQVFDGQGHEFSAHLIKVGREKRVVVGPLLWIEPETPLAITLMPAVSRQTRMEWALEKAVELGVQEIRPVLGERGRVRLEAPRALRKHQHWEAVIISAATQCGRARVPRLMPPIPLPEAVQMASTDLRLVLDPQAHSSLAAIARPRGSVTLIAGPESGFTEAERRYIQMAGWQAVRLGPRVLRAETATLAALVAIQTLWGDWR